MKLKKDKEQVFWEINARCQTAAKLSLDNALGYGQAMGPVSNAVSQAIAMAVAEGFKVLMENQYTDEDFERDLTLRP